MKQLFILLVAIFICTTSFMPTSQQNQEGQSSSVIINDELAQPTAMIGAIQMMTAQGNNFECLREFYASVVSCFRTSTTHAARAACIRAAYARLVACAHENN